MQNDDDPPWEELEDQAPRRKMGSEAEVYQHHGSLIAQLTKRVERLEAQLAKMKELPNDPPPKGLIGKGKYASKTHAWVLENVPDYVIFLDEVGRLETFGFTAEQLAEAQQRTTG